MTRRRARGGKALAALADLLAVLAAAAVLAAWTVPGLPALILAAAGFALARRFADRAAFALVTASLALTLGAAELWLRLTVDNPAYYRPQEALAERDPATGRARYRPNRTLAMRVPFGDIYALSNRTAPGIVEPRDVTFRTDAFGYRNPRGYAGERLFLVGDSFVVSVETDEPDTIAEVLRREHGIAAYNAGVPGPLADQLRSIAFLERATGAVGPRGVVLFLFEGNKFPCAGEGAAPAPGPWAWRPRAVTGLESYRLVYGLTRRALGAAEIGRNALVHRVGDKDMGFYAPYAEVVRRTAPCDWRALAAALAGVRDKLALIVFVPDKYRVYYDLLPPAARGAPLAHVQGEFVAATARDFGVPALDLTAPLQAAARELLPRGEYVFWRDDTHWNPAGIRAAAAALAQELARLGAGK